MQKAATRYFRLHPETAKAKKMWLTAAGHITSHRQLTTILRF